MNIGGYFLHLMLCRLFVLLQDGNHNSWTVVMVACTYILHSIFSWMLISSCMCELRGFFGLAPSCKKFLPWTSDMVPSVEDLIFLSPFIVHVAGCPANTALEKWCHGYNGGWFCLRS